MKAIMKRITRVDDKYMVDGCSNQFNSIEEAVRYLRRTIKGKTKKSDSQGRRFWSERLQKPFRSNWEIEIAELLTELGIEWTYEPKRFYFRAERESYLPDFYLNDYNCWLEVKGYMDKRSEKRCRLFKKYHEHETGFFLVMKSELELLRQEPKMIYALIDSAIKEHEKKKGGV